MSEKRPDFIRMLQRAEAELQSARPTPALDQRVLRSPRVSAWGPLLAVAAGALLIVLLLPDRAPNPASGSGGSAITFSPARCAPERMSATLRLSKGCQANLEELGLTLDAVALSVLKNTSNGVQLVQGEVRVQTQPIERSEPITMFAAGAQIRFSSTELILKAQGGAGGLRVLGGRAMLREPSKNAKEDWLERTQSRSWGQRAAIGAAPAPKAPSSQAVNRAPKPKVRTPVLREPARKSVRKKPVSASRPKTRPLPSEMNTGVKNKAPPSSSMESKDTPEIPRPKPVAKSGRVPPAPQWEQQAPQRWSLAQTNAAVQRVTLLRAQRHYAHAAALIAKLLKAPLDPEAAQVLSYERGDLLETKLSNPKQACVHWRAHRARFGRGRYAQSVQEKLKKCAAMETARPPGGE